MDVRLEACDGSVVGGAVLSVSDSGAVVAVVLGVAPKAATVA